LKSEEEICIYLWTFSKGAIEIGKILKNTIEDNELKNNYSAEEMLVALSSLWSVIMAGRPDKNLDDELDVLKYLYEDSVKVLKEMEENGPNKT